jgi:hypothetical protein
MSPRSPWSAAATPASPPPSRWPAAAPGHPVRKLARARRPRPRRRKDGQRVDNGQHILLGAYTETLRMLRLVGVKPSVLETRRLALVYPGEACELRAAPLPAPLHLAVGLLRARGLGLADKLAMARLMRHLKARRFRIEPDRPVAALLADTAQTERLSRLIWEPLCVAALNTPVGDASAQVFANVLRDSLAAGESASHLLIPRVDLSELFPVPASRWLAMRGHTCAAANPSRPSPATATRCCSTATRGNRYDHVVSPPRPTTWAGWWKRCRRWPRSSSASTPCATNPSSPPGSPSTARCASPSP